MKYPTRNDLQTLDALERVFRDIYTKLNELAGPQVSVTKETPPAAVRSMLESTGSTPLNVQGLLGQLAQPQLAYIPTVTSLPAWDSQLSQTSGVVRYNGTLYIYDQTSSPGSWVQLEASAVVPYGLFAARPSVTTADNGTLYYATDTNILYIVEAGSWVQLPPDASVTQTGVVNISAQEFNGVKTFDDGIVVDQDIVTSSTSAVYIGAAATDGTWKVVRSGDDLQILRRESGSYVLKATVVA